MGWYDHMGWNGGIMMIIWIILIIGITYWMVSIARKNSNPLPSESALDIVKKRYARGEISKEQYDQIRKDLR